jgi:transketolase C-terminal domain/subunit
VVIAPADEVSTKALVKAAAAYVGPVFIRTGRPKAPIVYGADQKFEIGKAMQVADGTDVTIIANGLLVAQALLAADTLEGEGISARVIDMHTAKPLDREAISRAASDTGRSWWPRSTWWIRVWVFGWRRWWPNRGRAPWNSWAFRTPTPNPASRMS